MRMELRMSPVFLEDFFVADYDIYTRYRQVLCLMA